MTLDTMMMSARAFRTRKNGGVGLRGTNAYHWLLVRVNGHGHS